MIKVAFAFCLCGWLAVMVAGVILWWATGAAGLNARVEGFLGDLLAQERYGIDGRAVFQAGLLAGVVLVVAMTALVGVLTVLFNRICLLTGGIRYSVAEVGHRAPRGRRPPPPDRVTTGSPPPDPIR